MPSRGPQEFVLAPGQELKLEDRWDPLLYSKAIVVASGCIQYEHFLDVPPYAIRPGVMGPGRYIVVLPPGYSFLKIWGCRSDGAGGAGRYEDG